METPACFQEGGEGESQKVQGPLDHSVLWPSQYGAENVTGAVRDEQLSSGGLCSSDGEHQPQNECYVQLRVRTLLVSVNSSGGEEVHCTFQPCLTIHVHSRLHGGPTVPYNSFHLCQKLLLIRRK